MAAQTVTFPPFSSTTEPFMKHRFQLGLTTMLASLLPAFCADFHVSPSGSDTHPGSLVEPFASLEHARDAARAMAGREPVTIHLHGGVFYLPTTLVLDPKDSGNLENPVVWRAWRNEEPVLSGGIRLQAHWQPAGDGVWKTDVPKDLEGDQLFINGERQILARYPNHDPSVRIFGGFSADAFSSERARRWADPVGGFIHAMHRHEWGDYHYRITGKNAEGRVTFEGGWQNNRQLGMHPSHRFVENIREELDAPGEWFLDRPAAVLLFHPPPGLDLASATVEVVRLRHLVEFRGSGFPTPGATNATGSGAAWTRQPVRHVTFEGLTFRHSARSFMENREPLLRSDWTTYRGGSVLFAGTEDCTLEDCTFDQVGGNAVFLSGYNRRITFRGLHIDRAGANGIAFVGDPRAVRSPLSEYEQRQPPETIDRTPGPQSPDYPADCLVEDCLIHGSGRFEKQTAPVQIAMASRITVRHCSLYEVPRAGINIGDGCWGGHLIEDCDVFDTVLETGDHGSFNSWGRDRYWLPDVKAVDRLVAANPDLPFLDALEPVTLRHNRWRCDHGWDIDLDDGSTNYRIVDNLCLNGGLKLREGFRRTVENNILVNNSFHPHVWYAASGDTFRRNIAMTWYKPIGMPATWGREIDHNLLPDAAALSRSLALHLDGHSVVGEPGFLNPSTGDFRVRDSSPARATGFRNFATDAFGVRTPRLRAIARTPVFPTQPPAPTLAVEARKVVVWLGAQCKTVTEPGEVSATGLPNAAGVLLLEVPADSAAAQAGFQRMDVLLEWAGTPVGQADELPIRHRSLPAGQSATLRLFRQQTEQTLRLPALRESPR